MIKRDVTQHITRGWCFTINNYTEADEHVVFEMEQYAKVRSMRQRMWRKWTPHLQGFVYFSTEKSMKQMKEEIHSTAHWEPMRGTVDQAAEYCKKEGEWFEAGVRPLNPRKR